MSVPKLFRDRRHLVGVSLVVVAILVMLAAVSSIRNLLPRTPRAAPGVVARPAAPSRAARPARPSSPTGPANQPAGLLALDDFQVTVPEAWERRQDWEDQGPGTKLFLVGPELAKMRLVVGVDVYPLKSGTALEQFVKDYGTKWAGRVTAETKATLCGQPARLIAYSEGNADKSFLLCVWRDKGFAIGMIAPTGQGRKAMAQFREVLDTFQVYE